MTKSYAQLKSAIAKLEKEAAAVREAEMKKVIAQIKESIATFGLTVEHLFDRGAKAVKVAAGKALGGGKAVRKGAGVPKYRDPKTGKTWTGFGKAPGWLATVRNRDKFLIDQSGVSAAPSVEKGVAPVAAVAKKAAAKKIAAPKKAVPAKKAAVAPKAAKAPKVAAKAAKKAVAKVVKSQPAAKTRSPRRATKAATPVVASAASETPETGASTR